MKKTVILLCLLLCACAFAQIDTTKWYPVDNRNDQVGACVFSANQTVANGYLTIDFLNSGAPFTCNGTSQNYSTEFIAARNFASTYGVIKARIRFGTPGNFLYSAFWMIGGASGSSAYQPTCINLWLGGSNVTGSCYNSVQTNYEIDIAENKGSTAIANNLITWSSNTGTNVCTSSTNTEPVTSDSFHIYELDWYANQLIFKMDGLVTSTCTATVSVPMYILFDAEPRTLPTSFPNSFTVDWVQWCQDPVNPSTVMPYCGPNDPTIVFQDQFNEGVVTTPVNHAVQGQTIQGGARQ